MGRKVEDLSGPELDYWVAKAEGLPVHPGRDNYIVADGIDTVYADDMGYSTLWEHGGPIIDRERITTVAHTGYEDDGPVMWAAYVGAFGHYIDEPLPGGLVDSGAKIGPTPLIAAMRAYVASKFGAEVPDLTNVERD